ncbi:MAG: gliding motility-associated C-terminal domain-containing protein, partial [Flavobacteriales bacterium]|nr:gliding motility-associated C-terminal domain-containing protein [Flavobacteriales bacterium]
GSTSLDVTNTVNPTFNNATPGPYTLTYTVTDDNGCIGTDDITVTVNGNPTAVIAPDPAEVCAGVDLVMNGTPADGSGVYTTHAWTNTGSTSLDVTNTVNPTFNNATPGPYTLTYTVTDDNGCIGTDDITVTVFVTPVIDALGPIVECESYVLPAITGADVTINAAYYDDTQLNGGQVVSGTITQSGTYYMYDGANGCSDEQPVLITINPLPTVTNVTGEGTYCPSEIAADILVDVTGSADWSVDYTLDGTVQNATGSSSPINLGNAAGVYVVTNVTDLNCPNTATGTQTITINPLPSAPTAGTDSEYCNTVPFADMTASGGAGTMTWYSDAALTSVISTGPTLAPNNTEGTTIYYVTETLNGCEGPESQVTITVNFCTITVPTAFTPDGDGVNDDWEILEIDQAYPDNMVYVYNRWGNLLFTSVQGDYDNNRWDGTYNGDDLPVGSYYFIIEYNNDENEKVNGIVSILK